MGYVGQHLVSVVTGYPGGKSGARGYDLVMNNGTYGEIKTCYRVDQLGTCANCGAVISSIENKCSSCNSDEINRKDDSKWLINIRNDTEFKKILDPIQYYFVLFEFEDLSSADNNIVASIWKVNPKNKGFAYCMIDYYLNTRTKSESKAPFNMWPYDFKFLLTKPTLIYRAIIKTDGTISTNIFPSLNNITPEVIRPLNEFSRAKTITLNSVINVIHRFSPTEILTNKKKTYCLKLLEKLRSDNNISNNDLCDAFAEEIYLPLILPKKSLIPDSIKKNYKDLQ